MTAENSPVGNDPRLDFKCQQDFELAFFHRSYLYLLHLMARKCCPPNWHSSNGQAGPEWCAHPGSKQWETEQEGSSLFPFNDSISHVLCLPPNYFISNIWWAMGWMEPVTQTRMLLWVEGCVMNTNCFGETSTYSHLHVRDCTFGFGSVTATYLVMVRCLLSLHIFSHWVVTLACCRLLACCTLRGH